MEITKTVNWQTKDGKEVVATIAKTREVRDDIGYADGWNINLGKKTVDSLEITLHAAGRFITRDYAAPRIVIKADYGAHYDKIKAAGGYARLGDVYINEENYNKVMGAIAEAEAEATADTEANAEFEAVKAAENAREARKEAAFQAAEEKYRQNIKNGMCPKCESWCYGDCSAN